MKLSGLFSKYLYQNKELNLPGIGSFSIDPSIHVPEPSDKNYLEFVQNIKFVQKPVLKPDEEFIDFIRVQTGKIRPLAESDLESFISDGKVLLNIGKPFYFEGIGSIQKNRMEKYEFIPGLPLIDKLASTSGDKPQQVAEVDRRITREDYDRTEDTNGLRKGLVIIAILVGLIAVMWGGYVMYNRNNDSASSETVTDQSTIPAPELFADSSPVNTTDTNLVSTPVDPAPATETSEGNYKYIIETTPNKTRAIKRYTQLKSYLLDIRMDVAADSSMFKLYFAIPSGLSDTTRIKDSLKRMYNTRMVVVERN